MGARYVIAAQHRRRPMMPGNPRDGFTFLTEAKLLPSKTIAL
jgi:hypothetical protein